MSEETLDPLAADAKRIRRPYTLLQRWTEEGWRERVADGVFLALLLIPSLWLIGYLWPPLNHDSAAILYAAKRILLGDVLYRDIIDVNPPLIFLISLVPEGLARLTGIDGTKWLVVLVSAAIIAAFFLCRRVLSYMPLGREPLTSLVLPALILFLLAVFPAGDFTQREHIMVVLSAPYVLLAAARADRDVLPLRLRVPLAIMAGIGFGLKPHFVLIPLTIELYVLYRQGWRDGLRDIVPWIVGLTLAAHVAIALIVTPDYFRIALPLTFKLYTKVSDNSLLSILDGPYLGPTIVALLPLVPAAFILSHSRLVQTLALFAIGAVISATAQGKGWSYQSYPAMTATLMLGAVFLSNLIDRYLPTDSTARRLPVAALAATFMLLLYYQAALFLPPFDKQRDYEESIVARLAHIIEREAPNRTVMVLSPGIYPIYPLANYTDVHLTQRFLDMWPVQGIYAGCDDWGTLYHSLEAMGSGEKFMFRVVPEDFAKGKPDLVIIDTIAGIPRCQANGFSYLDYFQRNPLFAKTFANYEKLMDIDRYEIYQRRKPDSGNHPVEP